MAADILDATEEKWFVVRTLYNKKSTALAKLRQLGAEIFTPERTHVVTRSGHQLLRCDPIVRSLWFVRSCRATMDQPIANDSHTQYIYKKGDGYQQPMTVPLREMENFKRACEEGDKPLFFSPDQINISKGTKVRIHGGSLNGVEGYFMKVTGARNKRVTIKLERIAAVAIAVNPDLLEVIQ